MRCRIRRYSAGRRELWAYQTHPAPACYEVGGSCCVMLCHAEVLRSTQVVTAHRLYSSFGRQVEQISASPHWEHTRFGQGSAGCCCASPASLPPLLALPAARLPSLPLATWNLWLLLTNQHLLQPWLEKRQAGQATEG